MGRKRTRQQGTGGGARRFAIALWVSIAVLAVSAATYLPFLSDDALISLRYADRLLDGQGLTWTDGERVEGYSNLLWILVTSLLGAVGFDLILAARICGFLGFAAVLLALWRRYRRHELALDLPFLAGAVGLVLTGPVAVWTFGGLEQPLLAGLLAWTLLDRLAWVDAAGSDEAPGWRRASILLALVCWTRPDGALLAVAVAAGLWFARPGRPALVEAGRLLSLPAVAVALQSAFRLLYYGDWIPNTARAKIAPGVARFGEGLTYVGEGLWWMIALALPAIALALLGLADRARAPRVRLLAVPLLVWIGYVSAVGGDGFPAHRRLVPVVVLLAFLLTDGLDTVFENAPRLRAGLWGLTAFGLAVLGVMQHESPQNERARLERWEWDGQVVGEVLRRGFPSRPLMAVDPAGTLPYFSGLPAIDMLGLTDRYLATHPPEDFGSGPLGHELGDGAYILERSPDLVVFCGPGGGAKPCFRSGKEMVADPRFADRYTLVTFEGFRPHAFRSQIWLRREGGKIGIQRDEKQVEVPAWFLMAIADQAARLDPTGRLAVRVTDATPAGLPALRLSPGVWRLDLDGDGSPPRIMTRLSQVETMLGGGVGSLTFRLEDSPRVTIDVLIVPSQPDGETWIRSLLFTRLDAESDDS